MKKVIIVILIGLGFTSLILGLDKTRSYLKGTSQIVREEVDDYSPLRLQAARIRHLIGDTVQRIFIYEDKVSDLEGRAEIVERTVSDLRQKFRSEKQLLEKIKEMLESNRKEYMIGDATYTFKEVNADALLRLKAIEQIQENIVFQESLRQDQEKAITQGKAQLVKARMNQVSLKNKLEQLESRNVNADLQMEVAHMTADITGSLLTSDSELETAFANYERRVAMKERRVDARLIPSVSNLINYEFGLDTQNAVSKIERFLKGFDLLQQEDTSIAVLGVPGVDFLDKGISMPLYKNIN